MLKNPIDFWDERHKHVDEWASGGDRALTIRRNKAFYLHRLGLILGLLDSYAGSEQVDILDAGCGKGWLTDQLVNLGHNVIGIDSSETAVRVCKEHRKGEFFVSTLRDFSFDSLFDVVLCMDVLFHILDDEEWEKSLLNLASLVTANGILIVADDPQEHRYILGDYIVHRSMNEYLAPLHRVGFKLIEKIPYRFAGNPNEFLLFQRV
ncbi:methyltransferase domain-containing protein [Halomonas sp. LR3S48]|uniref:class I SAM-dependent methyltransferase n=1 Tax=Halomonas sp. LR3S48 TaxID=2982694 RepID=UPI0021E4DB86|nr:methyltransferase domain-containing protein [Halomonas sp. LR3S48]UYG01952.1 methyltransferase domain-containing protein [Halomonas sp. LR3S48]